MGEFILLSAQEQASEAGAPAEGVIREGHVVEEIISYCEEQSPIYVVLGRPEEEGEDNLLSLERLQTFADRTWSRIKGVILLPFHWSSNGRKRFINWCLCQYDHCWHR